MWGLYDGNNKLLLAVDDGAASGGCGGLGSGQEATGEVLGQTLTIRVAAGGSSLEVSRRVVRDNKAERCKGKLASRENEAARRGEEVKALEMQVQEVVQKMQERCKDGQYENPDLAQEMAQLAAVQGQLQQLCALSSSAHQCLSPAQRCFLRASKLWLDSADILRQYPSHTHTLTHTAGPLSEASAAVRPAFVFCFHTFVCRCVEMLLWAGGGRCDVAEILLLLG